MKKIWFKRKKYGWGWYPSSWEGWVVILIWTCIFVFLISNMDDQWLMKNLLIILSVIALIWVSYKKGEKPRWQWGNKNRIDK